MHSTTCCFTGHRNLPQNKMDVIKKRLDHEIDDLITKGVTDFISGGAMGFDLLAASAVISQRESGAPIRLIFALPFRGHQNKWPDKDREILSKLLAKADEIVYVAEEFDIYCYERRNRYMVRQSGHCVAALINRYSGTGQTVRMAAEKGLSVINLCEIDR